MTASGFKFDLSKCFCRKSIWIVAANECSCSLIWSCTVASKCKTKGKPCCSFCFTRVQNSVMRIVTFTLLVIGYQNCWLFEKYGSSYFWGSLERTRKLREKDLCSFGWTFATFRRWSSHQVWSFAKMSSLCGFSLNFENWRCSVVWIAW